MNYYGEFTPLDTKSGESCEHLGQDLLKGASEDLAIYDKNTVLMASGDLSRVFPFGVSKELTNLGGIYALDINAKKVVKLETKDFDQSKLGLQPHGIYFSNTTKRLYVVSHTDELSKTTVQIFAVEGSPPNLILNHLRMVSSPLFMNHGLNDVVEGKKDGSD